jgi:hypothetical protein
MGVRRLYEFELKPKAVISGKCLDFGGSCTEKFTRGSISRNANSQRVELLSTTSLRLLHPLMRTKTHPALRMSPSHSYLIPYHLR